MAILSGGPAIADTATNLNCSGCVGTGDLGFGAVTTAKIKAGAITASRIKNGNITSNKFGFGAVTRPKIALGAVNGVRIANDAVTGAKIANDAVTGAKIANDAVTGAKIATGAVGSDEIANGTIAQADLGFSVATAGDFDLLITMIDNLAQLQARGSAYVFVTSETYTGNLGGVAGADDKCQALADQAGLPGVYMAWIADSVPASAPATRFFQAPSGLHSTAGTGSGCPRHGGRQLVRSHGWYLSPPHRCG